MSFVFSTLFQRFSSFFLERLLSFLVEMKKLRYFYGILTSYLDYIDVWERISFREEWKPFIRSFNKSPLGSRISIFYWPEKSQGTWNPKLPKSFWALVGHEKHDLINRILKDAEGVEKSPLDINIDWVVFIKIKVWGSKMSRDSWHKYGILFHSISLIFVIWFCNIDLLDCTGNIRAMFIQHSSIQLQT